MRVKLQQHGSDNMLTDRVQTQPTFLSYMHLIRWLSCPEHVTTRGMKERSNVFFKSKTVHRCGKISRLIRKHPEASGSLYWFTPRVLSTIEQVCFLFNIEQK